LFPPLRLVNDTVYWQKLTLPDELVEAKGRAMEEYRSQLPLLGTFLRSFVRRNELFCELTPPPTPRLVSDQEVTPIPAKWRTVDGSEVLPLLEDSTRDTMQQEIGGAADFVALYVARTETEVWVAAELRDKPSNLVAYSCLVRAANGEEISKARILYPVKFMPRPRTQVRDLYILTRFTLQELGNPHSLIVSLEAHYPGGRAVDRIGWVPVGL